MRLTAEQRAAASALTGPLRIVAGPGTGKTAVITERFRRLVAGGVPADSILVLTFTERAASEMRGRIAAAIGDEPANVGTFHALAMRWLREDGRSVGVHPAFSILEGAERWIALRELMWELADPALVGEARPDDLVTPLLKVLERLKQELVPVARLEAWCRSAEDRERAALLRAAAELFRAFERRNRQLRRLDFDDILVSAVRMLESQPSIRGRYQDRFRHLMVDEYQDTDLAQERLVELLGHGASVCVVGDDDQSIYRFRGASRASMERFVREFADAPTITLGRNRRSTAPIVAASAALIECNPDRIPKALLAGAGRGRQVTVMACGDEQAEAEAIVDEAACLHVAGLPFASMAVLCRTNAIARPIAEALRRHQVPVRHWGAQGLYELPVVRDVVAMLRLLLDADDQVALARLLSRLGGGVEAGLGVIRAGTQGTALDRLAAGSPAAAWAAALARLRPSVPSLGAEDLFFELMSSMAYLERPAVDAAGVAAVSRFGEIVGEFCERSVDQSLRAFLARLDLVLLSGYDEEVPVPVPAAGEADDAVHVMTIHQAKGLEFDAVFVPAMVEGRLPQPHRVESLDVPPAVLEPAIRRREDHVAEERRLAYVAMTRARRLLYLSWAERYEGSRAWRPSRFLAEAGGSGRVRVARFEAAPAAPVEVPAHDLATLDACPPLSFSAIAAYRDCPRQHWFRYRVGLPAEPSMEAQYGTVVHAVLMRAGAARARGEEVGPDAMRSLLDEEWPRVRFSDPRRAPALRALAAKQLSSFVAGGGLATRPAFVERAFTADLDGWRLRGIIDRIEKAPPPTQEGGEGGRRPRANKAGAAAGWRLVDYKTGSPLPASRLRRDLQLALYALGARAGLGLEGRLELEIVYLKDGRRVVVEATDDLLAEAQRAGAEVARGIAQERFEPRPERRRCALCAYRLACDAAR